MKKAFITGVTGQDGSYLAELLLKKGYLVYGLIRRSSSFNTSRIDHIYQDPHKSSIKLILHYGDLTDGANLNQLMKSIKPDEVYNLGAQSHVRVSFDIPEYSTNVNALGTIRILDAIRESGIKTKFYQASSSEMFGSSKAPQNEMTPFCPVSPYAASKVYAHWITVNYRKAYNMFACNGILFNHESPRRGETFVTRKITRAAARIKLGMQNEVFLGNLDAKRDWGYAPEFVEAIWMMMQQDVPDDYVVATGETHTVKEFVEEVFNYLDLDWKNHVRIDKRYFRPTEVDELRGDPAKIKEKLGWQSKVKFKELVKIMIDADMKLAEKEKMAKIKLNY